MTRRRLVLGLAWTMSLGLGGCGAGTLYGLVGDLTGGGDDGDFVLAVNNLSHTWRVTNYSGTQTGGVSVPASTNLIWDINSDFTFTVTSDEAVSIGNGIALLYDEAGTWRLVDAKTGQIAFTLTRHAGLAIPTASRVEATGTFSLNGTQLVITTAAIGPGSVRYVMAR